MTFFLHGDLDSNTTALFQDYLKSLGNKKGTLLINSGGGCDIDGFAMYDLIKLYDANLTAVVVGDCQSSAILPLLACKERVATANASFMFHHGDVKRSDPTHQLEYVESAKEVKRMDDQYIDLIVKHTKLSEKKARKMCRFGYFFGVAEAIKLGFIADTITKLKKKSKKRRSKRK